MDKKKDALNYCQVVRSKREENKLERAVIYFTRAVKLDKSNSTHLLEMVNAIAIQDKYKEAATLYRVVLSIDPKDALAFYNFGYVLQMLGKVDKSIEMYKEAIHLHPKYTDALKNLAAALITKERYEEAEENLWKVLNHEPSDGYIVYNCWGYSCFLQGEFAKARTNLQKSISLNEKDPFAYFNMSLVLFCEEKSEEALKYFERGVTALEADQNPVKILKDMIRSYTTKKTSSEMELNNSEMLSEEKITLLKTMVKGLKEMINLLTEKLENLG